MTKKRVLALVAIVALTLLCLFGFSACGVFDDGYELDFKLINNDTEYEVEINSPGSDDSEYAIEIPSVYDGKPVTSISGYIDYVGCGLTAVTIPDSIKHIKSNVFARCTNLRDVYYNGDISKWCEIEFSGYCSNPLCFAKNLYLNNEIVTDIVIPDDVTEIDTNTFAKFVGLKSITVGNGVTSIADGAFDGCVNLKSAKLSDSVTSIGVAAFFGCTELEDITIGSGVEQIARGAFSECKGLKSVYFTGGISDWCKIRFDNEVFVSGSGYEYSYGSNPLWTAHNLYINNELVTDAVIPDEVTDISAISFVGCTCIKSVTLPVGIESIGMNAFKRCDNLTTATMPTTVLASMTYYPLKTIIINGGESIDDNSFMPCSIESLIIGDSVKSMDANAFENVSYSLSTITVDENNQNFSSLNGILYNKTQTEIIYVPRGISGDITLSEGITKIKESQFYGCHFLTGLTVPACVVIEKDAFWHCDNLTTLDLKKGASIHDYAFEYSMYEHNMYNKLTVKMPASMTYCYIPDDFYRIIESLYIYADNSTVFSLSECNNLVSVEFEEGIIDIYDNAFTGCAGLTNAIIPDSVAIIGGEAFKDCSNLTSITFKNTIGWEVGGVAISSSDLSDKSKAAQYLRDDYCNYTWRRIGVADNTRQ